MDTTTDCKTFRGRSLEEVLPQIRAELGPEAIVVRRREGLAGGVAGFFQRSYVEVDARPGEPALETRNDRATAEGLASPAIRTLVDQAAPSAPTSPTRTSSASLPRASAPRWRPTSSRRRSPTACPSRSRATSRSSSGPR